MEWARRETFDRDPTQWYQKFWDLYGIIKAARPTVGHQALSDMVGAGIVDTIVTQNIDRLDRVVGTDESRIIEVHGQGEVLSCTDVDHCGYFIETDEWLLGGDKAQAPECQRHEMPLKPDVMLFEDWPIPDDMVRNFLLGQATIEAADVLLVVGTTLEITAWHKAVYDFAVRDQKPVVVINPHTSRGDDYATFRIHEKADDALPVIRDLVLAG